MPILNVLPADPPEFPAGESHFLINGPAGNLELLTTFTAAKTSGVAIICHPHPLHLGTMNNKVVTTLARAFMDEGLHTIRFNFRGVGKSEGKFGDSQGEIADLQAVLTWADKVLAMPKVWLAGFSFGAFIAANGAKLHACQQLFTVAPAVTNQDYANLNGVNCPWVVIQGDEDEVIASSVVYQWFHSKQELQPNMQLIKVPQSSHFFHGKLIELRSIVTESFLKS